MDTITGKTQMYGRIHISNQGNAKGSIYVHSKNRMDFIKQQCNQEVERLDIPNKNRCVNYTIDIESHPS